LPTLFQVVIHYANSSDGKWHIILNLKPKALMEKLDDFTETDLRNPYLSLS